MFCRQFVERSRPTLLNLRQRQHSGPDHVALTQSVVEADKAYNVALNNELRTLQARLGPLPPGAGRGMFPMPPPGYPYVPYPVPGQPGGHPGPMMPPAGPIPVQLPARLLPTLKNMGIVPVPVANATPTTPCVQHGTMNNGNTISLTINLQYVPTILTAVMRIFFADRLRPTYRLLQPVQMSGLAMLLNSLVPRPPPGTKGSGPPPPPSPGGAAASS
jgi:hypothetical protein